MAKTMFKNWSEAAQRSWLTSYTLLGAAKVKAMTAEEVARNFKHYTKNVKLNY